MTLFPDFRAVEAVIEPHTFEGDVSRVREEYERLAHRMKDVCADYGLQLSAEQELDLRALMRFVECLDRYYDAMPDRRQADHFLFETFSHLHAFPGVTPIARQHQQALPEDLMMCIHELREVLLRIGCLHDFTEATFEACRLSRQAQEIDDVREYIRASIQEGALKGRMMLMTLNLQDAPPNFSDFMVYAAATGKLLDNFMDRNGDYQEARMRIQPGMAFTLLFTKELIGRFAHMALHYPNKRRFAEYRDRIGRLMKV